MCEVSHATDSFLLVLRNIVAANVTLLRLRLMKTEKRKKNEPTNDGLANQASFCLFTSIDCGTVSIDSIQFDSIEFM